jgi:hypothetical protein
MLLPVDETEMLFDIFPTGLGPFLELRRSVARSKSSNKKCRNQSQFPALGNVDITVTL